MTHIKDFNEIFDFFKKRKLVQSLKEFPFVLRNIHKKEASPKTLRQYILSQG